MRILASADVHGEWPTYEWLLEIARDHRVEAIVLAGDLLGCPDGFDTPEAAQRYESWGLADLLATALGDSRSWDISTRCRSSEGRSKRGIAI